MAQCQTVRLANFQVVSALQLSDHLITYTIWRETTCQVFSVTRAVDTILSHACHNQTEFNHSEHAALLDSQCSPQIRLSIFSKPSALERVQMPQPLQEEFMNHL